MSNPEIEKFPQIPETYDELFANSEVYALPYKESPYYPMFLAALREVERCGAKRVLEVGCGTVGFAQMLLESMEINYQGFDFSPVAVRKAKENSGRPDLFTVSDATERASYEHDYDCIVCTEVLEHIEDDLKVVQNWKEGAVCVCSVPNTDSKYHVRFFSSEDDVRRRYGGLIEIDSIIRVNVPQTAGMTMAQRLKAMAVNFYRPHRLIRLTGLTHFSWGGWFVFVGVRRNR